MTYKMNVIKYKIMNIIYSRMFTVQIVIINFKMNRK